MSSAVIAMVHISGAAPSRTVAGSMSAVRFLHISWKKAKGKVDLECRDMSRRVVHDRRPLRSGNMRSVLAIALKTLARATSNAHGAGQIVRDPREMVRWERLR